MTKYDPVKAVFKSGAEQLSRLMSLDEAGPEGWVEADQAAMLRHQLGAPLAFDLNTLALSKAESAARDRTLNTAAASQMCSFRDLLQHPSPPLELLRWAKDFFKLQAGASARRRPEQEVAYVLYLLSIALSRVRAGERITSLTDADLVKALKWAGSRKWLDAETREVCALARKALTKDVSG